MPAHTQHPAARCLPLPQLSDTARSPHFAHEGEGYCLLASTVWARHDSDSPARLQANAAAGNGKGKRKAEKHGFTLHGFTASRLHSFTASQLHDFTLSRIF